ncbi:TIGR00730 family Rossman fold protein [Candidatus Dependentiae bacterium]|nr:MAG: TIGR00730 family Rossman fold protein [Candidatus Dependentiae bacterium]
MILRQLFLSLGVMIDFIKVLGQLVYGVWQIGRLPQPIITVFGSARHLKTTLYDQNAFLLAEQCTQQGISVLTGGGPGIMEAANCGGVGLNHQLKGKTLGIGVKNLQEKPNKCAYKYIQLDYFFARKWLLMNYSKAFVIFPGGFGTLDELAELLTLIQTKKLRPMPLFLFGTDYWKPLVDWLRGVVLDEGAINAQDVSLITLVDCVEQIIPVLKHICEE